MSKGVISMHQVQQCLEKASAKYADSAKSDIMGALREFKDLSPDTENFIFPDGKQRHAFKLRGTIPVIYKGTCYNIPVSVYLWDTHPYYAPICYVTPTSTMVIKESENVNKQGRIFLPYLNEWRFPGYDLNGLLQVMAMVFQEKCPLYSKSTSSNNTSTSVSTSQQSSIQTYPTSSPAVHIPYPSNPTPYPTTTPYPIANSTQFGSAYANTPYPPAGSAFPATRRTPPAIPTTGSSSSSLQPEHIRASVLSALEDKIKMRIRERLGTSHAEIASIRETQAELQSGQHKLRRMIEELEKQQKELGELVIAYQDKKEELTRSLANCDDESHVNDIDSAIDAATPLHRQLLNNYAQDLACDDVIYALGQALKERRISIQEYLRYVRDISRKQFVFRATMQKCRKAAGLPI